jgi:hypothetical protein
MINPNQQVDDYFASLPEERQQSMNRLRAVLLENLPDGFEEVTAYKMPSYSVPHSIYPAGYHCDSKQALPFISIASQKNFVAIYHMGLYADSVLLDWFTAEYPKYSKTKLDIGKSCIRFKKPDEIPFELLGELFSRMKPQEWIVLYEKQFRNSNAV